MSPSPVVTGAVQANLVLIAQGLELLSQLGPARYGTPVSACFNSSAGGHFRHVIEHYQALLAASDEGELDYENRARDPRIENDVTAAAAALRRVADGLRDLSARGAADRTLRLAAETVPGERLVTSLARELEFLISHTVHHYALIAVIARSQQVEPPADFGMAPSTLKFRTSPQAACAR